MDIDIEPTDKKNWTLPSGWSAEFNQHTAHNVCVWSLFQRFYITDQEKLFYFRISVCERLILSLVRKGIGLIRIESNRRGWMDQMAIFRQGAHKYKKNVDKIFLYLKKGKKTTTKYKKGSCDTSGMLLCECTFSNKDNLLTKMNITKLSFCVCRNEIKFVASLYSVAYLRFKNKYPTRRIQQVFCYMCVDEERIYTTRPEIITEYISKLKK